MEIAIYIIFFITGITFGSFYTLATHRIPLNQDITHERSYCPNCNHKLSFWDLVPIFSYLFLKGKCRYCKHEIKIKYLLIELLSGILFIALGISLGFGDIYSITTDSLVFLFYEMLFISTVIITSYIEKEKHYIENSVIGFGMIVEMLYIIYLYVLGQNIYKYVIYLSVLLILLLIDTYFLKKRATRNYTIQILLFCVYLLIGTNEAVTVLSIIVTLLGIAIREIFTKKGNKNNIPIGYYMGISNIVILVLTNCLRG